MVLITHGSADILQCIAGQLSVTSFRAIGPLNDVTGLDQAGQDSDMDHTMTSIAERKLPDSFVAAIAKSSAKVATLSGHGIVV
jgi:hypothetical protein